METKIYAVAATLISLFCSSLASLGQTTSTWSGGTGNWQDAAGWSPNGVPNDATADVVVDGAAGKASVVTFGTDSNVGADFRIGRLLIAAGDTVQFGSAPSTLNFWDSAAFPGAGALTIHGLLHLPYTSNALRGSKNITGTGTLRLGSTGGNRPEIYDTTTNAALIQGSALFGRANASSPKVINSGTIEANLPGQDIDFHGQGGADRSINTGTLRAVGGGKMQFGQGEWLNTGGLVMADGAGSQVAFYRGGLIEGGTISATNGGVLQVGGDFNGSSGGATLKNVTLNGPTQLVQELRVNETLTNNGVMTIPSGAQLVNATESVTIAGSGQIVLDAPHDDSPELLSQGISGLWLFSGVKVRGRGNVGNVVIINQGTFEADVDEQTMLIDAANFDNRSGGILRATGSGTNALGGVLRLRIGGTLKNTGGTIEALSTGRVDAGVVRVEGGLVRNVGGFIDLNGWTLVNPGTGMTLEGELTLGSPSAYNEATLVGAIENKGLLRIEGGTQAARLWISENANRTVTLTGGGQIQLGNPSQPSSPGELWERNDVGFSGRTLANEDNTIRGYGRIGNTQYDPWLVLENSHRVQADVTGQTLSLGLLSARNAGGTFRAMNGGRMTIYASGRAPTDGFNNTDGVVEAEADSTVAFFSTEIKGGTITSAATGTLEFPDFNIGRGGLEIVNAGTTVFGASGGTQEFSGLAEGGSTFNNTGTISKIGSGDYTLRTALTSSGSMSVEGGVLRNFGGGTVTGGSHTAAAGTDLTFQGAAGYTFSGTNVFSGDGTHWFSEGVPITLANASTELRVENLNLNAATITGPGLLSHTGILKFWDNSANSISGVRVLTLPGGTAQIEVRDQSFDFLNEATWENRGTVSFKGYNNPRLRGTNGTFFENTASGTLSVDKLFGAFGIMDIPSANKGQINVAAGSLSFEKPSTWTGGRAAISADQELRFTSTTLRLNGTANSSTGAGFLNLIGSSSLAFESASRLTAERIQFNDSSGMSGPGELQVGAVARFHPYGSTSVINGTQINLLAGSTNLVEFNTGILRLQDGAKLRNAGTLDFRAAFAMDLITSGILENAGTMTFTSGGNDPTFTSDATGLFRTTTDSNTRFFPSNGSYYTVSWPFDFAGRVAADSGMIVAFDRGGVFNGSAKIAVTDAGSKIIFAGQTAPYRVTGFANESLGPGTVVFENTRILFEDPTSSPEDDPTFSSASPGAIAFAGGTNTSNTSVQVEGNGTLAGTRFVFASPSTIIDRATLETIFDEQVSGPGSTWIATGGNLTLTNGAKFVNGGVLAISTGVGAWTGAEGTLFHITATGRLIHDTQTTTDIDIPFLNEGFVEFRAGNLNFIKNYRGDGGIAVSGGSKVELRQTSFADGEVPRALQASGVGSELKVTLNDGQIFEVKNPDALKAEAGAQLTLAKGKPKITGPGTLVADGTNSIVELLTPAPMVAAGGGNILSRNQASIVAAGGLNVDGQGSEAVADAGRIESNAQMVAAGGGNLRSQNGGAMVAAGGLNVEGQGSEAVADAGLLEANAQIVAAGGGNLSSLNGGMVRQPSGAGFLSHNGGNIVAAGGGNIVAAGGGNIVAAGGGNIVAAGGGNIFAAGGGNVVGRSRTVRSHAGTSGHIIAEDGGRLSGSGNFEGAGVIEANGTLSPGDELGQEQDVLSWVGALEVKSGGLLEIQIGGLTAGTQYDRINISGTFVMNGQLIVSFVNGFGPGLTPASTFDLVVADGGATSALDGTRLPVTNADGTFLVSIVDGGTTLRLSDYQTPPNFSSWAQRNGLTGADALPLADPRGSGMTNLMKYALGLDASASGSQGTTYGIFTDGDGKRYLTLSYTKPAGEDAPSDLLYEPQRSASLNPVLWSGSSADVVPTGPPVPGPGSLETVTVRSTHPIGSPQRMDFMRLRVVLLGP